jgi:hypothetical protein
MTDVDMMDEMLMSNSPPAIQQRIQAGRIGWVGPLALTTARTGLILFVQAVVAAAFLVHRHPSPCGLGSTILSNHHRYQKGPQSS